MQHALHQRQQAMIPIAALSARAARWKNSRSLSDDGLDAGLTVNEIKEILIQLYAVLRLSAQPECVGLFYDGGEYA
ncbi:Uncharacterised protein [Kluyvera cryocrescens]|uniref:Uncharacterized protein n=1 Tax=Kluyvera cryocrescens TaxID=580 RepID=A0A485D5W8_KLUCR|nr:Uncharacterised protein [Kluyvera cryocrescens]